MSKTDHARPARRVRVHPADTFGRRQPRPLPRRGRTRSQATLLAVREASR